MKKITLLSITGLITVLLSGCDNEKNTITYDFKDNKVILGEFDKNIQVPNNIQNYSYVDLVLSIYKNCNLDEKAGMEMRNAFQKGINYITPSCSNGITYKFINTDKAPQE